MQCRTKAITYRCDATGDATCQKCRAHKNKIRSFLFQKQFDKIVDGAYRAQLYIKAILENLHGIELVAGHIKFVEDEHVACSQVRI